MMIRRTAGSGAMVAVAAVASVAMMITTGCERDQYDPEATPAAEQTGDSPGGSHHYALQVDGTDVDIGDEELISVQVFPSSDLRINLDFPWSFEIADADGLEVDTRRFDSDAMELSEEVATIPVAVTADTQGEYTVEAEGDFSVCNDQICHTLRGEDVEFVVDARQ